MSNLELGARGEKEIMTRCICPYNASLALNDDMHDLIHEGTIASSIFVFNVALRRLRGVFACRWLRKKLHDTNERFFLLLYGLSFFFPSSVHRRGV